MAVDRVVRRQQMRDIVDKFPGSKKLIKRLAHMNFNKVNLVNRFNICQALMHKPKEETKQLDLFKNEEVNEDKNIGA